MHGLATDRPCACEACSTGVEVAEGRGTGVAWGLAAIHGRAGVDVVCPIVPLIAAECHLRGVVSAEGDGGQINADSQRRGVDDDPVDALIAAVFNLLMAAVGAGILASLKS